MSDVLRNDYSPLLSLNVDLPPIGVKFSFFRPNNIAPLEKSVEMSLCEILHKAQVDNKPFYFSRENAETCVGKIILGMESFTGFEMSGQIGERLGVFEARANQIFISSSRIEKDTVNYVLFSPVDQLT